MGRCLRPGLFANTTQALGSGRYPLPSLSLLDYYNKHLCATQRLPTFTSPLFNFMHKLHTVYDFRIDQAIIPGDSYILIAFAAFGFLLFFYNIQFGAPPFILPKGKYFGLVFGIFALLIFLVIAGTRFRDYSEVKNVFDQKLYNVIEGRVQEYHPMPAGGHDTERFRVGNLYFTMSDFDYGIMGYNHAASHGGVIRSNLYVRIWYPTYGRIAILHLETE